MPDARVKASVYGALYSTDPLEVWAQPHHSCSTGDCTWEPIPSICICTECEGLTAKITKNCATTRTGLSNCTLTLLFENAKYEIYYLYGEGKPLNGKLFEISSYSGGKSDLKPRRVVSLYIDIDPKAIATSRLETQHPNYLSSQCTLHPCIQSIKSSFSRATLAVESPYKEEILKTWKASPDAIFKYQIESPIAPEYGLYGQNFSLAGRTAESLFAFIDGDFSGTYTRDGVTSNEFRSSYTDEKAPELVSAIWYGNYSNCGDDRNRVSCAMHLAAKAMSKTFRDAPYVVNGTLGTAGIAYSPVIHVLVTWQWIALPVLVWVLALATFFGTAWKSTLSGVYVWRNNPLPLVFMRVDGEVKERGEGVGSAVANKALSRRARGYEGSLRVEGDEIRLVKG
jgi:hypothetical protein